MIINCPECGGTVSDKAVSCPHCGCPIKIEHKEHLLCPKCLSDKIEATKQGFSAGRAIAGSMVFGLQGALVGGIGASRDKFVCLRCGNTFELGSAYVYNEGNETQDLEVAVVGLLNSGKPKEALELLNSSPLYDEEQRKKYWMKLIVTYAQKPR